MYLFIKKKERGLTLIETIVGIGLLSLVFVSILGLAQLSLKLVSQSKAKITATALANQKIELTRNLAYNQIGTVGGIPAGSMPETETIIRNNITYTVKTSIFYVDDPFDGVLPVDLLAWDYKRVKIKVSWSDFFGGEIFLQTDITPKGIETTGGGGIISILVFDADGQLIPQADIKVENSAVLPTIDATYQTDNQGRLFIPGAPACNDCYKITASKHNYSLERTYTAGESIGGIILANPSKPFLSVINGQLSEISFTIDKLATKTIQTVKYVEEKNWIDSFDTESKISDKFQTVINLASQSINLEQENGSYKSSGYLVSVTITPSGLVEWGRLNWVDEKSASTEIKIQILYFNGTDWVLIPDNDLTVDNIKNSDGFNVFPVDISTLDSYKYKSVRLKANFSTLDPNQTPLLFDWGITWFSSDTSIPINNLAFIMQGSKTLGTDSNNQSIYKYKENLLTNPSGQLVIFNLEWDSYKIFVNGQVTGYDIANSSPAQPVNINPGVNGSVTIKLINHQTNNLLITVKNSTGQPLVGANIRLYKTGYDKNKLTTDSGQAFFSSLTAGTYGLEVKMSGYQDWLEQINVSGQAEQVITMTLP